MTQLLKDCTAEFNILKQAWSKKKAILNGTNADDNNNFITLTTQAFRRLVFNACDSHAAFQNMSSYHSLFIKMLNIYTRSLNDGITLLRRRDDDNSIKFAADLHEEICSMTICLENEILPALLSTSKQMSPTSLSSWLFSSILIKLEHTSKVIFPCLLIHLELLISARLKFKVASIMNSVSGRENFRGNQKIQNTTIQDFLNRECLIPFSAAIKTRCGDISTRRLYTACIREITIELFAGIVKNNLISNIEDLYILRNILESLKKWVKAQKAEKGFRENSRFLLNANSWARCSAFFTEVSEQIELKQQTQRASLIFFQAIGCNSRAKILPFFLCNDSLTEDEKRIICYVLSNVSFQKNMFRSSKKISPSLLLFSIDIT